MTNITEIQLGYLAGFVDGEGCLAICKRKHKNKFGEWIGYSAHVDLTNINKEVMEFIKRILNISSKIYDNPMKGNRRLAYRLRLNMTESKKLVTLLKDYLIVKREQAKVFLEFCDNSKDPIEREELWAKMATLNKRGL